MTFYFNKQLINAEAARLLKANFSVSSSALVRLILQNLVFLPRFIPGPEVIDKEEPTLSTILNSFCFSFDSKKTKLLQHLSQNV